MELQLPAARQVLSCSGFSSKVSSSLVVWALRDPGTKWLGLAIICFMPFMLNGAFVTLAWIPGTRDVDGRAQGLEKLKHLRRTFGRGNFDVEASQPPNTGMEMQPPPNSVLLPST